MAAGGSPRGGADSGGDDEIVEQAAFVDINITPLVDIFLVLLVILMATSTAILEAGQGRGSGFKVQLPTGTETPEVQPGTNELIIAVPSDGSILVNGQELSLEELEAVLRREAEKSPERLVLVQADEDARHKRVVAVMEIARKVGLRNLAIATRSE